MSRITDNGLPQIPSEFIEPYLATFMGSMVEFIASAITEEEKAKRNGLGWTVAEINMPELSNTGTVLCRWRKFQGTIPLLEMQNPLHIGYGKQRSSFSAASN